MLVCVLLSLFSLLVLAATAPAAGPATVTVEVEGTSETKLPPTQVTTTTAPVVKDGNSEHSCPGTSAAGALQLATAGDWGGPWSTTYSQYEIYSILGELHEFEASSKTNYYWSFWLNDKESSEGACLAELEPGDRVLFFPACYGEACQTSPTPLGIEAPTTANAGEAVAVTVKQYNAKGEAYPAANATVSGGGVSATTDSEGHATLRFYGDVGSFALHAYGSQEGPPAVRTQTTICVHEGNDGTCGTTVLSTSPLTQSVSSSGSGAAKYRGPFAVVAKANGIAEGHVYPPGKAPRLLSGTVTSQSPITLIDIELRRTYRGRCSAYDGTTGRFVKARCGHGSFFAVASGGDSFSYLLPAKLAPGRYVLDLRATDEAGNVTTLARGSTRTVFYVR
jgi:hypothetical protein